MRMVGVAGFFARAWRLAALAAALFCGGMSGWALAAAGEGVRPVSAVGEAEVWAVQPSSAGGAMESAIRLAQAVSTYNWNCPDGMLPQGGGCQTPTESICPVNTPILENGRCRAAISDAECVALAKRSGAPPHGDFRYKNFGGECDIPERVKVFVGCGGSTPIVGLNFGCRAMQERDCPSNRPIFQFGQCRAAIQSDCTELSPVVADGRCVLPNCPADKPFFDTGTGQCRTAREEDCTGARPVFENDACREREARDCIGATPILGDDKECRAAIQADCDARPATPILDGGACRARVAADCTGTGEDETPFLDVGECISKEQFVASRFHKRLTNSPNFSGRCSPKAGDSRITCPNGGGDIVWGDIVWVENDGDYNGSLFKTQIVNGPVTPAHFFGLTPKIFRVYRCNTDQFCLASMVEGAREKIYVWDKSNPLGTGEFFLDDQWRSTQNYDEARTDL